jgi:hypothetical protein
MESIVALNFEGYLKELRVWDYTMNAVHDHMLFFKSQIVYFNRPGKARLSDYLRFIQYDRNADIFTRYMPAANSLSGYAISIDVT